MKHFTTLYKVRIAFIACIACTFIFMCIIYANMRNAEREAHNVRNALTMLHDLESLLIKVQAIETGQRGFAISGDEAFLAGYTDALSKLDNDIKSISKTKETTEDKEKLNELLSLVRHKIDHSKRVVEIRRIDGFDSAAAVIQNGVGQKIMDSISNAVLSIETKDRAILVSSNSSREAYAERITYGVFFLSFLFILIIITGYFFIKNDIEQAELINKRLHYNATLLRTISDPIITADNNGIITNWNSYAGELYGFSAEEAEGKSVDSLLMAEKSFRPLAAAGSPEKDNWKTEATHYHKDGKPIQAEVSTSLLKGSLGEVLGTVSVVRDITERKELENKLKQLGKDLQLQVSVKAMELNHVFERVTDAFIALDNDWVYTHVNKIAAQMHNKKVEELIGKNIWEVFPDVMKEPFYKALQYSAATKQSQRLELYSAKEERWYEDLIYPGEDGISVYYHDITERKKAGLALEKVHEKLNYHISNTPLAVVEYDSEFNMLQWSKRAEEIFGWSEEEVKGMTLKADEIVYPDDKGLVYDGLRELAEKEGGSNIIHNRNITKSGEVIFCEWYNSVLKDEEGKVTGILSLVKDVTDRRKMELDLIEAESKFRTLVEQSLVGVYILQGEKFVYVNPRFAEIFGYEEGEITNSNEPYMIVDPEDRSVIAAYMDEFRKDAFSTINYEFKGLRKSGEAIHTEVYGTMTKYRGRRAIIGTIIDITDRKNATERLKISEEELKVSNNRFELASKATNDALWDIDMVEDKIWGNEIFRDLFGEAETASLLFEELLKGVEPADGDRIVSNFKNALNKKEQLLTEEFTYTDAAGVKRVMMDKAYVLYDESGKAYRILGAMQDISVNKEAENRLLLEKNLSDSIINSLPGIFYLYNRDGEFYRWNKNFEKVTGYSAEEIKNRLHPLDLFGQDEKELLISKIGNVFENGEDAVEASLLTKSGALVPYYFTGMVIKYEGEICLMGVGIDISEQVRSQKELEESEEKFRTVMEQASDAIFISDEQGNYVDVNARAAKLTGYKKEELLQMTANDLFPDEDVQESPFKFGELLQGLPVLTERTIRKKDGSTLTVEISANYLGDGRFQGILRDVTERKKAEEALKASEHKYRVLFDQNPLPMWIISYPERIFIDANEAASVSYGYSKEEFLKMTIEDLHPERELFSLKYDLKRIKPGIRNFGTRTHIKKDKTEIKVNIISHDIIYEGHRAILALANDVTQKFEAEENLQRSHEAMRELASHLETIREAERTHMAREIHDELGQQLTGLKMDISWLNRRIKSEDKAVNDKMKDTIELIDKTVVTVRRIATQLRPSILDDLGLVAAMEWQTDEFEKRSEIKANFTSNVSNITVKPDVATGIFRIFQESLTNVLRHSKATKVETFLSVDNDTIVLNIKDNGIGFKEADISNKKTLGLLGMKERVLLIRGTYEINGNTGSGTSVIITVPLK
jgi:PAS domain S-box-containing protein